MGWDRIGEHKKEEDMILLCGAQTVEISVLGLRCKASHASGAASMQLLDLAGIFFAVFTIFA